MFNDEKSALVFLVMRNTNGGFNYKMLLVAKENADGKLAIDQHLPAGSEPMSEPVRWVSELGAVSSDGTMILVKMGWQDRPVAPYNVNYLWETWDLRTAKLVKKGLRFCDP